MQKLEKDVRRGIENKFIKYVGELVYTMREKRHIRQEDLADCVGVSRASLSSYENAENPLPIKLLPLISLYCDFPMRRFVEWEEEKNIKKAFSKFIEVTAERYKRREVRDAIDSGSKKLVGKVYADEEGEWVERLPAGPGKKHSSTKSESIRSGEYVVYVNPMTDDEFVDYVRSIDAAEQLCTTFDYIRTCHPKRSLIEESITHVVTKIIVEPLTSNRNDETAQRAYAYYQKMLKEKKDTLD